MANKGLGKGLAALFSEIENESTMTSYDESGKLKEGVNEVDLALIDNNPNQPRKQFDEASLNELAQSIKSYGVLQPIILADSVNNSGRYIIIAGERRFRAAKMAELKKIPAIIRNFSERERKEVAIIENIQRENLNPIEEASAYKTLIEEYGVTQEVLATTLGKSRPALTNSLRLLTLNQSVIDLVKAGRISAGHARCLVVVKDSDMQLKFANIVIENKMSVRELEELVNNYLNPINKTPKTYSKASAKLSGELKSFLVDLQRTFATKVKISGDENKGRIVIDYFTNDDLQRIYEILKSKI